MDRFLSGNLEMVIPVVKYLLKVRLQVFMQVAFCITCLNGDKCIYIMDRRFVYGNFYSKIVVLKIICKAG